MKISKVIITRKFSLGKQTYENEDLTLEFDVSDENISTEQVASRCFDEFHVFVEHSDLPQVVKDFYKKRHGLNGVNENPVKVNME